MVVMTIKLAISKRVIKYLSKLDNQIANRLKQKLKTLKQNPVPSDAKFIDRFRNDKIFRLRIGEHRALYKYIDEKNIVIIEK